MHPGPGAAPERDLAFLELTDPVLASTLDGRWCLYPLAKDGVR